MNCDGTGQCGRDCPGRPHLVEAPSRVFNVGVLEIVRTGQLVRGEEWVQLRGHHSGDGDPVVVQMPASAWQSAVDGEVSRLTVLVDELTAQRDAFGQKAHQLQERMKELEGKKS
jgi:hypothetical protein